MTTGYGDVVPHTATGEVIAGVVMVVGIGFFAQVAGNSDRAAYVTSDHPRRNHSSRRGLALGLRSRRL